MAALRNFLILLMAVIACAAFGQMHLMYKGDPAEWDVYIYGLFAELFIMSALHYRKYDYSDLKSKYMAFIMCSFPLIQALLFTLGNKTETYSMAFQVFVTCSLAWFLFATFRRDSISSDTLADDYVYIIAKRPDSFGGFLVSFFGMPYGRYAYYHQCTVFHFKNWRLRQTAYASYLKTSGMKDATIINSNVPASEMVRTNLIKKVGNLWPLTNCLTVLWRV